MARQMPTQLVRDGLTMTVTRRQPKRGRVQVAEDRPGERTEWEEAGCPKKYIRYNK